MFSSRLAAGVHALLAQASICLHHIMCCALHSRGEPVSYVCAPAAAAAAALLFVGSSRTMLLQASLKQHAQQHTLLQVSRRNQHQA
jgi:hypothetical protein